MSSNFFKAGTVIQGREARVINSNELVSQKLDQIAELLKEDTPGGTENFMAGIDAKQVEVLLGGQENTSGEELEQISRDNAKEIENKANQQADAILANVKKQAEQLLSEAQKQAEQLKEKAQAEGRLNGHKEALREQEAAMSSLQEEREKLEADYRQKMEELEPQFIQTITDIYEHIFQVHLDEYREIVVHLVNQALRNVEAAKNYLIHVSKEDYPYVSMKKKDALLGTGVSSDSVEIIEDFSIGKGQCLIETDGGIFDCGLGTQLERLNRELRLLSYGND